jgi:hypothetical protein
MLTPEQKVKNIFAFLAIVFGEDLELAEEIMEMRPEYLIEKFDRYVLSDQYQADWGLHPSLRKGIFNRYCIKHKLNIISYEDYENKILNKGSHEKDS